jgi:metal-dependent amidase/aminoacylase/carboxypeptidase family protein
MDEVPVMHACGHDTHIILMGTAEILASIKSS